MRSPETNRPVRRRDQRGYTILEVVAAMAIGTLVIGGFMMFWLSVNQSSQVNEDLATQETMAVASVGQITKDLNNATAVLYASPTEIIIEQSANGTGAGGDVEQVGYESNPYRWVHFKLVPSTKNPKWSRLERTVYTNPRFDTDGDGTPNALYGANLNTTSQVVYVGDRAALRALAPGALTSSTNLVDKVPATVTQNGKTLNPGSHLFTYFNRDGVDLGITDSSIRTTKAGSADIARIEVDLWANFGNKGNIQLPGTAVIHTSRGGEVNYQPPQCHGLGLNVTATINAAGDEIPVIGWNKVQNATSYQILRDGAPLVKVTGTNASTYSHTDTTLPWGNRYADYSVIPQGVGGSQDWDDISCRARFSPTAQAPVIWGSVSPGAPTPAFEGYVASPKLTVETEAVRYAHYYEVTAMEMSPVDALDAAPGFGQTVVGQTTGVYTVGCGNMQWPACPQAVPGQDIPITLDVKPGAAYRVFVTAKTTGGNLSDLSHTTQGAGVGPYTDGRPDTLDLLTYPAKPTITDTGAYDFSVNEVDTTIPYGANAAVNIYQRRTNPMAWTPAGATQGLAPSPVKEILTPGENPNSFGPETANTSGLNTLTQYVADAVNTGPRTLSKSGQVTTQTWYSGASSRRNATQFPKVPPTVAEGSDWDRDDVVDHWGENRVSNQSGAYSAGIVLQRLESRQTPGDLRGPRVEANTAALDLDPTVTSDCPGKLGDSCFVQYVPRGSESIYSNIDTTRCNYQGSAAAMLSVAGQERCPSFNRWDPVKAAGFTQVGGAQDMYKALAVSDTALAYQAPDAVPVNLTAGIPNADACYATGPTGGLDQMVQDVADTDDNHRYHCQDYTTVVTYTPIGDDGQPTADSKFCGYRGLPVELCASQVTDTVNGVSTTFNGAGRPELVKQDQLPVAAPGTRHDFTAAGCNRGGCSDNAATTWAGAYPALFSFTKVDATLRYYQHTHWVPKVGQNPPYKPESVNTGDPTQKVNWSASVGAVSYSWDRVADNLVSSVGHRNYLNEPTSGSGVRTTGEISGSPTSRYFYTAKAAPAWDPAAQRKATSAGGYSTARVMYSPPPVSGAQEAAFCRPSNDVAWRPGFAFRLQGVYNGTDITPRTDAALMGWWVGGIGVHSTAAADEDAIRAKALDRWLSQGLSGGQTNPSAGGWAPPGSWTTSTEYWGNHWIYPVSTFKNRWWQALAGSNSDALPHLNMTPGIQGASWFRADMVKVLWTIPGQPVMGDGTTMNAKEEYAEAGSGHAVGARLGGVNRRIDDTEVANCLAGVQRTDAHKNFDGTTDAAVNDWWTVSNGQQVDRYTADWAFRGEPIPSYTPWWGIYQDAVSGP